MPYWASPSHSVRHTDILMIDHSYPPSGLMIASSHQPRTKASLPSICKSTESRPRPQQEPLFMAFAARHEALALLQPIASSVTYSEDARESREESNLQKTSILVSEQDYFCIWDAFHLLERLLLETAEPATSDLPCLAYLEDRLRRLLTHN